MSSQRHLLASRRFGPLFLTQFLGAFNDNLFKNALIVLVTFQSAQWTAMRPEILANLAAGLFILPYFLFSATAGQLADKYDKAMLARLTKLLEVAIAIVAMVCFLMIRLPPRPTPRETLVPHSTLSRSGRLGQRRTLRDQWLQRGDRLLAGGGTC